MRTPPRANDRNKLVAAALAFLLGTLGIHRFYLVMSDEAFDARYPRKV